MSGVKRYDLARQRMEEVLRAEHPPEVQWERVERALFARLDRPASLRVAPPTRSTLREAFGIALAAAAMVLGVLVSARSGPTVAEPPVRFCDRAAIPLAAGAAGQLGDLDFLSLRAGDAVESADAELSLVDTGSVRWTLMPRSRAVVRVVGAHGVGHVVALQQGSIRAEVVPRDPAEGLVEAFAVEVDGTRVAVHGTLFTVTRASDHLDVDVEHGAVAIGPAAYHGATTAHLLVGPSRGSFSLDGKSFARLLPPSNQGSNAIGEPPVQASSALFVATPPAPRSVAAPRPLGASDVEPEVPSSAASRPQVVAALRPPAAQVAADPATDAHDALPAPTLLTPAAIQASLARCFAAERLGGAPLIHRSISSTLHISVSQDGSIAGMRFDPPLRPVLQACAEPIYAGRLAGGSQTLAIPLTIEE